MLDSSFSSFRCSLLKFIIGDPFSRSPTQSRALNEKVSRAEQIVTPLTLLEIGKKAAAAHKLGAYDWAKDKHVSAKALEENPLTRSDLDDLESSLHLP
jgi:hypothetical protein